MLIFIHFLKIIIFLRFSPCNVIETRFILLRDLILKIRNYNFFDVFLSFDLDNKGYIDREDIRGVAMDLHENLSD